MVDTRWDPPVTVRVRLVSVIADDLMHVGQAAYVRGIVHRRTDVIRSGRPGAALPTGLPCWPRTARARSGPRHSSWTCIVPIPEGRSNGDTSGEGDMADQASVRPTDDESRGRIHGRPAWRGP